jgi:fructoselysine-6-P-deglycase FrlB-like protein
VVLSQSGASRTTIEAAIKARERGCEVVRITAEPESPFAQLDDAPVLMPIGPEPIGPKTKGFGASLAALAAVADALGGRPENPPSLDANFVGRARAEATDLAQALPDLDFVLVAGAGAHLGTALEASLKISEMSGIPSAGFDMEEALHGRLHGLTERSLAVFIAGTPAEVEDAERAAATMRELGPSTRVLGPELAGALFRDGPGGAGAGALDPIHAIVPFQWLAWALAGSRGLDPAAMRYPGLSTRLAIKTNSFDQ